jgi:hypothetical protein
VLSLAIADIPSPTAATTTTANSATPRTSLKVDKGKRTTSAESTPHISQYTFSGDDHPTRYVPQQYVQPQSTKPQDISYVPLKSATEPKKQQIPEPTFSIQYVPAQQITHSFDTLARYEPTPKYQFLSKIQQQPVKGSPPSQHSASPQQLYIIPAASQGFAGPDLYSSPHYTPAPTAYLHSVPTYTPGHHIFSPLSTYVVPQHSAAAYSLQPVVMMFTLPGGHYLNTASGQNALLALLHGANNLGSASSGRSSPDTAYVVPRQPLTYYIPTVAHPTASQVSEIFIGASTKLRIATVNFVMSVCPSVLLPQGTTPGLPQDRFS